MNLYKIIVGHAAPKDWHKSMVCMLLAENEETVFDWIASEPKIGKYSLFNSWKEKADAYEEYMDEPWSDDNYPDFKTKIIALKGEINDDDYDFSDSYYGITLYGWELIQDNFAATLPDTMMNNVIYMANQPAPADKQGL